MTLSIKSESLAFIRAHAAREYPNECCGFLIGSQAHRYPSPLGVRAVSVDRVQEAVNVRFDSRGNRFAIDPLELMRVDRDARVNTLGVVGFYHSHPDAPAAPSDYDREHAFPGYCYVIVSVDGGFAKEINNWVLEDEWSHFRPDPIIIEESV